MPPLIIAHRGASGEAPENTMAAFELARVQGADMVELDVQRTADGTLVVFHDDTTERWNGRPDAVSRLTWDELRAVPIDGEPVALFEGVCEWAATTGMSLNVELKVRGVEAPVAELLRRYGLVEQVLVSSFHPQALAAIRKAAPEIRRAVLTSTRPIRPPLSRVLYALKRQEAVAWHPEARFGGLRQILPLARRHGYDVNVWTVDHPGTMRVLARLGATGIITNYPARLRAVLAALADAAA